VHHGVDTYKAVRSDFITSLYLVMADQMYSVRQL